MRQAYFDCFSGAAGDMILGALLDAGCPLAAVRQAVGRLGLEGVELRAEKVRRGGFAATLFRVEVADNAPARPRHLPEILRSIDQARLDPQIADIAKAVFQRLAEAEAAAHGIDVCAVHFHEVGAVDALVDIVGAAAALAALGIERVYCSPLPAGSGTVTCAHGVLPVPAPATARLLIGCPTTPGTADGELTTPTGAAVLTTLAAGFGPLPEMTVTAVGYGAGTRESPVLPNVLRVFVGESGVGDEAEADTVVVLEANLDDLPGQTLGHACQRLLEAGALDAYVTPIVMKKGRPGQLLSVLCRPVDAPGLEALIFRETSTFGVRYREVRRSKLARRHVSVATRFGPIRIKLGTRGGQVVQAWPEYDDCVAAARTSGVALRAVVQEALRAWTQTGAGGSGPADEPNDPQRD